jgi:hypothetical protein
MEHKKLERYHEMRARKDDQVVCSLAFLQNSDYSLWKRDSHRLSLIDIESWGQCSSLDCQNLTHFEPTLTLQDVTVMAQRSDLII